MADSIIRLKVESQEYDAKLKRASEGLTRYADECRKVGGTLEVVEKDTLDYVRSLGRMDTASRTATGKLAEMRKAFVELSAQYKQMTDAEKASPFGKALAQSLSQLKTRIGESRSQLEGIKQEMSGGLSGALDAVAGKFGLNIGQLTKFGGALAAAKGAMELANGVIESTEAAHDAFAKAVEVSDNMTNQFLRSLATADFSNFINGMQGIIDKTIAAYEAMDEFESYAARFQPWQQAKESEIQTKLMQARAAKAQGDKNRAEQLTNEAKELINQLQTSTRAYGEKQTKGGFSTIRSLMGQVDISDRQIAWYVDPKNWDEATRKAEKFARLQEKIQRGNAMSGNAAQHAEARRAQQELDRDPSLRRAYTMMNLRDSGDSKQAQQFRRALGDIYGNTLAESRVESLRARADRMDGILTGGGRSGGGSSKTFKAEKQTKVGFSTIRSLMGQVDISDRQIAWYADPKNWDEATRKAEKFARLQEKIQRVNAMSGNAAQHAEARRAQQELDRDPSLRRAYTMMNLRDSGDSKQAQQFRRALGDIYGNTLAESRVESLRARADRMDGILTGGGRSGGGSSKTFKAESISSKYLQGMPVGPTESLSELRRLLQEAQQVLTTSTDRFTSEQAEQTIRDLKAKIDLQPLALRLGVSTEEADRLKSKLDESIDSITEGLKPIEITVTTKNGKGISSIGDDAKDVSANVSKAAGAVSQLGSALAAMEDPGVKVAGMIANAIASVAMTFASSLKGTVTPWDWIAAAVAGTATMVATIASIKSATSGYAEGGMIPGNSYSGDNQLARVNAGEIILNRAQQSNVANALENPSQSAPVSRPSFVRGQDIYLGLNNYLRASGRGQLITSRH